MRKKKTIIVSAEEQMSNDLIPKNPIVNKRTRIKREHVVKVSDQQSTPLIPEARTFSEIADPFKDARAFVEYYRACISLFAGCRVKFELYEIDCPEAASIMDILIGQGKTDKNYLTAWFRYFFDNKLKGHKILKSKFTSLKAVRETLVKFDGNYILNPPE